jgi:hypothetical protein
MCLAPIGSIPPPIDTLGLGIGIELDISGIGDTVWLAAAVGCPEDPQAAATRASAPTATPTLQAEPGRPLWVFDCALARLQRDQARGSHAPRAAGSAIGSGAATSSEVRPFRQYKPTLPSRDDHAVPLPGTPWAWAGIGKGRPDTATTAFARPSRRIKTRLAGHVSNGRARK